MARNGESAAARVLGRIELVLDAIPRAVVVADLEGTILAWNKVAERAYALGSDGAARRSIREFFPAGTVEEVAHIADLVRNGETWSGAVPNVREDGTVDWVFVWVAPLADEDGTVVGLVGAADDAQSELHLLQQKAAELNEHLVLALAAGQLGTWRWDKASGVTEWDATLERIFGVEPGGFDGTFDGWVSLIHADDREATSAALQRALDEASGYTVEHRVIWPDGSVHWIQGRGTVTLDADGNVTGTIGCASDITASKELEIDAARRAAQAEARRRREHVTCDSVSSSSRRSIASPSAARDHKTLMRAVTAAAVPELGDWCTLHFMPEPGGTLETEVAHADPKKVEWAVEMRQRFPFDADSPRGVPAVIRTGRLEFLREVTPEVLDLAIEEVRHRRTRRTRDPRAGREAPADERHHGALEHEAANDRRDPVRQRRVGPDVRPRRRRPRGVGRRAHRRSARQRVAHRAAPLDRRHAAGTRCCLRGCRMSTG